MTARAIAGRRAGVVRRTVSAAMTAAVIGGAAAAAPPPQADGWARADHPREWSFPRDHGSHPEFRTEWWYFTGLLQDAGGRRWGYQLTFFRHALRPEAGEAGDPWSVRDVYPAHFALTDAADKTFSWAERLSRSGPGLAGAREGGMDTWVLDWSARMEAASIRLKARNGAREISLALTPRKPPVLHGEQGLSRKGPGAAQASYYYSLTDLESRGTLRNGPGEPVAVRGKSWFDHEFGSNQLAADQAGWDWFSLRTSDGRELMLYLMRRLDGSVEAASSGTLVEKDGSYRHLALGETRLEVLDRWRSGRSGGLYPSRWRLAVPSARLELELRPILDDQELTASGSTGVTYWEGAVEGSGSSLGERVTCEGYVELTGYAGALGGLF